MPLNRVVPVTVLFLAAALVFGLPAIGSAHDGPTAGVNVEQVVADAGPATTTTLGRSPLNVEQVPVTAPPPTTTTEPSPAPEPGPAPAPEDAPAPEPEPGPIESVAAPSGDLLALAQAVLVETVPARWLAAAPVRLEIIEGDTSWSYANGRLQVSTYHLTHGDTLLRVTIAHEWGHHAAFRRGSKAYLGAPPAGFPFHADQATTVEQWADCVAEALTGIVLPSHGLAPCPADARAFTEAWIQRGP